MRPPSLPRTGGSTSLRLRLRDTRALRVCAAKRRWSPLYPNKIQFMCKNLQKGFLNSGLGSVLLRGRFQRCKHSTLLCRHVLSIQLSRVCTCRVKHALLFECIMYSTHYSTQSQLIQNDCVMVSRRLEVAKICTISFYHCLFFKIKVNPV